jgi:hypothetical protein
MPSSVISKFSYNNSASKLRLVFLSGKVYDYLNVPEAVYLEMKNAASKGTFLNQHIKRVYQFKKLK